MDPIHQTNFSTKQTSSPALEHVFKAGVLIHKMKKKDGISNKSLQTSKMCILLGIHQIQPTKFFFRDFYTLDKMKS